MMMYLGWLLRACTFIKPCSPYLAFRAKVCHTRTDAATSPEPDTYPLVDTNQIHDYKEDKDGKQASYKYE